MGTAGSDEVASDSVSRRIDGSSKLEHSSLPPKSDSEHIAKKESFQHLNSLSDSMLDVARTMHSTPAAFAKFSQSQPRRALSNGLRDPSLESIFESHHEPLKGIDLSFYMKKLPDKDGFKRVRADIVWTDKQQSKRMPSCVYFRASRSERQMRLQCSLGHLPWIYTEEIRFPWPWTEVSLGSPDTASKRFGSNVIKIDMALLFPDGADATDDLSDCDQDEDTALQSRLTDMQSNDPTIPWTLEVQGGKLAANRQDASGSTAISSAPSHPLKTGEGASGNTLPASTIDIARIPLGAGEVVGFFRSRSSEPRTLTYSSRDSLCFSNDYDLKEAPLFCQLMLSN